MAKSRKPPTLARSGRELARLLSAGGDSVTERAVRKWLADPRWEFSPRPPWDAAAVQAWRARTLEPDPARADRSPDKPKRPQDLDIVSRAKLSVVLERARLIRQQREVLAGKFAAVADIERQNVQRIVALKAGLFALARSIANELVGRSPSEVADILTHRFEDLCNRFAGDAGNAAPGPNPPA